MKSRISALRMNQLQPPNKITILLILSILLLISSTSSIIPNSEASEISTQKQLSVESISIRKLQDSQSNNKSLQIVQNLADKPTRTPKPSPTPPTIPPSQNIGQTNLMILFVILAVIVVLIGVWLNREKNT